MVIQALAKVNLTLHVLGRRSDGYHELDTVMQKIELCDLLYLSRSDTPAISLSCPDSNLAEDSTNLVWQAAVAFFEAAGIGNGAGVSIVLEKNIPIAAGLGGGSSDAAAVLCGMNHLFDADLSQEILLRLAVSLGADVPFFVAHNSAVRATGIGEKMSPCEPLADCSLLLVNPGFSVSTAWVFKNFTLTRADKNSNLSDSPENAYPFAGSLPLYNDLESVTVQKYPELEEIKLRMLECGAHGTLMSGSGATVFGIFPDHPEYGERDVRVCAEKMKERYGLGVFVTRPAR